MTSLTIVSYESAARDQTLRLNRNHPVPKVAIPETLPSNFQRAFQVHDRYPVGIAVNLPAPNVDRLRALPTAAVFHFPDGGAGFHPDHDIANAVRVWDDENGEPQVEWIWDLDRLREVYHEERRRLRQAALYRPLPVPVGGKTVKVKRPSRISIHDHAAPGLTHLERLCDLSAADYEAAAPLFQQSDGVAFRPTKTELRAVLDAELGDHKIVHEKSAATEAHIDHWFAEATKDLPEEDDSAYPDAVIAKRSAETIFRAFDTAAFWETAPPAAPQYPVLQAPAPAGGES